MLERHLVHAMRNVQIDRLTLGVPDLKMVPIVVRTGRHHTHRMLGLQGVILLREEVGFSYRSYRASSQRQA